MFYGTASSYIEFPNKGGLHTRFSITLTCWVQPGGQDGPLFSYALYSLGVYMRIFNGKFSSQIITLGSLPMPSIMTEVLSAGKWVHVAASYDHNSGNNSLYINGHLRASQNIGTGYEIATASQRVRMGVISFFYSYFKGKVSEMKVYDVALNEAQIRTSIRQGSRKTICALSKNVVSLPSPVIPFILLIKLPLLDKFARGSRHPF